jgi:nitrous oxidase accessory protein NosD
MYLVLGASASFAQAIRVVDDDAQGSAANCGDPVPAFPAVGAAIAAAGPGDTVVVCPGTYFENINFSGKAISVRSVGGPDVTILDGNAADSVVTFASGEGPTSVIEGFTIRNGRSGFDTSGFGNGGGVRIEDASPGVYGNTIVNNRACTGAGIYVSFGSPVIEGNTIAANVQSGCSGGTGGGGIRIGGSSAAVIRRNVIRHNVMTSADGGGIALFAAGSPLIELNVISDNRASGILPCAEGGGISIVNHSDARIAGNLIVRNHAGCGGGLYWLVPSGARGPLVVNNTLADNDSPAGSGIFADGFDRDAVLINNIIAAPTGQTAVYCGDFNDRNPPQFRFNNVLSLSGLAYGGACADQTGINGNISAAPVFVNAAGGDYHLLHLSPGVDMGENVNGMLPAIDLDGDARILDGNGDGIATADIGADELAAPDRPTLATRLNTTVYRHGDTMTVTAIMLPGPQPVVADAYIVARLPTGLFVSLRLDGSLAAGIVPIVRNMQPGAIERRILQYTFNGSEPRGTYVWYAALTTPGTLSSVSPLHTNAFTVQ